MMSVFMIALNFMLGVLISQVYNISEHQGTPMILHESRWANIDEDALDDPRCGLNIQRYYLKKRLNLLK